MLARSRIVYVLLLSAVVGCAAPPPRDDPERPDILLILVDTLRADHLGVYGYERDTSPNLDAWAKRGIVFDQARSTAPWTNPAIASLFAGLYPQSVLPPATHKEAIRLVVPDSHEMLAERLHTAGYRTVALVDHPGLGRGNGFGQGFEIYDHLYQLAGESGWTDTRPTSSPRPSAIGSSRQTNAQPSSTCTSSTHTGPTAPRSLTAATSKALTRVDGARDERRPSTRTTGRSATWTP